MKKIKLALLLLGIAVFANCSGDAVESMGADKETTMAKLTVIVRDALTGKSIDGAQVSLLPSEPVLATDGIASFEDVRIGNHTLKIEKTGYASVSRSAEIDISGIEINQTEGEYIFKAFGNSIEVRLHPESAKVHGYIYYINAKGLRFPAEGVKVYFELYSEFVKKLFEETTDSDGKYSFENLPADVYPIRAWAVPPEDGLDGIAFESIDISTSKLLAGGDSYYGYSLFALSSQNLVFGASYNKTVAKDGIIEFTFTEAIDQSSLVIGGTNSTVTVTPPSAIIKWESNKLTITPAPEWEGIDAVQVKFNNLVSVSGKTLSLAMVEDSRTYSTYQRDQWGDVSCAKLVSRLLSGGNQVRSWRVNKDDANKCDVTYQPENPTVKIALEFEDLSGKAVDGLAIATYQKEFDYDAYYVELRWNLVEGAQYYDIYRKDSTNASYILHSSITIPKGATIGGGGVTFYLPDYLNGRTVSFIVQARNATSISPLDPEKAISIRDNVKPRLIYKGTSDGCLIFSEPIDKKTLGITPKTAEIDDGTDDDEVCIINADPAEYTISGIQDQYGNKYGTDGSEKITIP
jgi:hypothetical protein